MNVQHRLNRQSVWRHGKPFLTAITVIGIVVGPVSLAHHLVLVNTTALNQQVRALNEQIYSLKQQQAMPAMVLTRYRASVCYVFGIYTVGFPHKPPILHTRISGSGFLVEPGLIATNRHIAEPWYGDPDSERLIAKGAIPSLEKLVAYFPESRNPVDLSPEVVSPDVDLAVVRIWAKQPMDVPLIQISQEEPTPSDPVAVVGYPLGVFGMAAKSPNSIDARLASSRDTQDEAAKLAAQSLIRPSATFGRVEDVMGTKFVYDAPTAHGASGGPVFNSRGEVVGINTGYIDGFPGGTFGVTSSALKPLIETAKRKRSDY